MASSRLFSKLGGLLQKNHSLTWSSLLRNAHHPDDERRLRRRRRRRLGRRRTHRRRSGASRRRTHTPDTTIDAGGAIVLPGFIQTHIHLCQTLFRGAADDLPLLAWLRERDLAARGRARRGARWRAAARLAAAELQLGGTTSALTMETVHGTDAVFEALVPTGLRAVVGKCLMDVRGDAPARLHQPAQDALDESARAARALARRGRRPAARGAGAALRDLVHARTARGHGAPSRRAQDCSCTRTPPNSATKSRSCAPRPGWTTSRISASLGLASPRLCAAHCVWVTDAEQDAARRAAT